MNWQKVIGSIFTIIAILSLYNFSCIKRYHRLGGIYIMLVAIPSLYNCLVSGFTSTSNYSNRYQVQTTILPLQTPLHYSTINIEEEAPRDVQSFEEWALYNGIQRADGFQLVGEDIDGFLDVSAYTTQDMPAGSDVLYIPNEMILSSTKAMEEFGRIPEAEQLLRDAGYESEIRHYYLMLKILSELDKGENSPYYLYFNSLPRYFANGASMILFCYTCIPPLVASLCKEERARLNNLQIKRPVQFISNEVKGDAELWKWVFQIVYTRAFNANDGSLNIVPMGDYFNHGTENEIWSTYDEAGNCYVQTTKDVPANSPLRMSYGDATNPSFLLARYGFLDETSPATFCKILPSHITQEMKDLGYAHNRMLFYKDTGEVSEEVYDILLYMALGEMDTSVQQKFYQAHMQADYATKQAIHEMYTPQTMQKLSEHIETFLGELEALEKKGEYGGKVAAEDHPRLPLVLRHNEFVRQTFLTVRSVQGLDQNSYV